MIREKRLIFAVEREDIPFPARHREFEISLTILREECDAFHCAYEESLEHLPPKPKIAPDALRALSDDEAGRVFKALQDEGMGAGKILLFRAHRNVDKQYAHCKRQVYEQSLLVKASYQLAI